ncbi:phosphotransferase family protein [Streptomyces phytophilus]|uniref:phosphotransferase family protein n=1 Tax=Streptomyces phytophilus TaxID=722715 RepID=UPI0015F0A823|nr:aminoglycoside phosphotransferase family protein [Streptomyces phytophilus]
MPNEAPGPQGGLPRLLYELRLRWHFWRHRRRPGGILLHGQHNTNYVVPLDEAFAAIVRAEPGASGKIRTPMKTVEVLPRTWRSEADVLAAVQPHLPAVPTCLLTRGGHALHTFTEGTPLSAHHPADEPVGEPTLRRLAEVMRRIAEVPADELPPLPPEWPVGDDTPAFLRTLVDFAETRVYLTYHDDFGTLFEALGITGAAARRFGRRADDLTRRPFRLLHTDLHRDNVLRLPGEAGDLFVVDWEIALYGDPLHELATHLVRMGYGPREAERMKELWCEEMAGHGLADATRGFEDLEVYLDFERAQSLYPDTMRTALSLSPDAGDAELRRGARRVRRSLDNAVKAAGLARIPAEAEVMAALADWLAGQSGYRRRQRLKRRYSAGALPPPP